MSKTRSGKKILSLLLTLCMALSLLPAISVTADAAAGDSWVGSVSFDNTEDAVGVGWTWEVGARTLTISGVNVTGVAGKDAIHIEGVATVVLEGANKVAAATNTTGLYCSDALTVKGSGTLDITGAGGNDGLYSAGNMTIDSGYITVTVSNSGVRSDRSITVCGGYVSATVTASDRIAVRAAATYTQTGGYVKTNSLSESGLTAAAAVINGGYLEATGRFGITTNTITNSGGVIKATGTELFGIYGMLRANGGVTIVSGHGGEYNDQGISESIMGSETTCWELDDGEPGDPVDISDPDSEDPSSPTSFVVAKGIAAPAEPASYSEALTLAGLYIYKASGIAVDMTREVKVTEGCYIESGDGVAVSATALTVEHATLVGVSPSTDASNNTACLDIGGDTAISADSTVVALSGGAGGYSGWLGNEDKAEFGNLIGIATGSSSCGVEFNASLYLNGGYVYGAGSNYGLRIGVTVSTSKIQNSNNGYATAHATGETGVGISVSTHCAVEQSGALTAIGNTAYKGSAQAEGTSLNVNGTNTQYGALSDPLDFVTDTYKLGGEVVKVLTISKTPGPAVFKDN